MLSSLIDSYLDCNDAWLIKKFSTKSYLNIAMEVLQTQPPKPIIDGLNVQDARLLGIESSSNRQFAPRQPPSPPKHRPRDVAQIWLQA